MHEGRHPHAFEAAVERARPIGEDLVVIAGHRRLIELQHIAAGGLQVEKLGIDGGRDIHRELGLVGIGFVQRAVDDRHRPRDRDLHRPVRVRLGKGELAHAGGATATDLADDARDEARASSVAIGFLLALVLEINALPGRRGVIDEAFAPLLAVGQDVEANLLLIAQRDQRGIVLRLCELFAFEAEGNPAALGCSEPSRPRQAADAGCHQGSEQHVALSALALCRR
jgi:hypothetical protein